MLAPDRKTGQDVQVEARRTFTVCDLGGWQAWHLPLAGTTRNIVDFLNQVDLPPNMKVQVFTVDDGNIFLILTPKKPVNIAPAASYSEQDALNNIAQHLRWSSFLSTSDVNLFTEIPRLIVTSTGNGIVTPQGNGKYTVDFFPQAPFFYGEGGFQACVYCFNEIKKFLEREATHLGIDSPCVVRLTDQFSSQTGVVIVGQFSFQNLSLEDANALLNRIRTLSNISALIRQSPEDLYKSFETEGLASVGHACRSDQHHTAVGMMFFPLFKRLDTVSSMTEYIKLVSVLLQQTKKMHEQCKIQGCEYSVGYQITSTNANYNPLQYVLSEPDKQTLPDSWRLYTHIVRYTGLDGSRINPVRPKSNVAVRVGGCALSGEDDYGVVLGGFCVDSPQFNLSEINKETGRISMELAEAIDSALPGKLGWIRLSSFFHPESGQHRDFYLRMACENPNKALSPDLSGIKLNGEFEAVVDMVNATPNIQVRQDLSDESALALYITLSSLASVLNSARRGLFDQSTHDAIGNRRNFGSLFVGLPNPDSLLSNAQGDGPKLDGLYGVYSAVLAAVGAIGAARVDRVTPSWFGSQEFAIGKLGNSVGLSNNGIIIRQDGLHKIEGFVTWSPQDLDSSTEGYTRPLTPWLIYHTIRALNRLGLFGDLKILLRFRASTFEEIYGIEVNEKDGIGVTPMYYVPPGSGGQQQIDTRDWIINGGEAN